MRRLGPVGPLLAALLVSLLGACSKPSEKPLTVFAAASLGDVLPRMVQGFDDEVQFSFAASLTLANQMRHGMPADLLISASPRALEVVPGEHWTFASNRLVIAVSRPELAESDGWPERLLRLERVAIGTPGVAPVGDYALAGLEEVGLDLGQRLIPTANARAALASTLQGATDAALVYASDAAAQGDARVVFTFPPLDPPIEYVLILPEGASPRARALADFLRGPQASQKLEEAGFLRPETGLP
ncbi:MAG: molybdate ABC transporter substrate-binding protein [Vulcanimicrobiota bacterium]